MANNLQNNVLYVAACIHVTYIVHSIYEADGDTDFILCLESITCEQQHHKMHEQIVQ